MRLTTCGLDSYHVAPKRRVAVSLMIEARSSNAASHRSGRLCGDWLDDSLKATLDALDEPVAILDRAGTVLHSNTAWWASASPTCADASCPTGENYLKWGRRFGDDLSGVALCKGVSCVLTGAQPEFEQICWQLQDGASHAVRVRVRPIRDGALEHFLVSHHEIADAAAHDIEQQVLAAQIQERERLATELHDSVGQNLVCLGLGLAWLRRLAPPRSELSEVLGDMGESLQQAHAQIRTLSYLLHPPWSEQAGAFEAVVREFVTGFARRAELTASLHVSGFPHEIERARELILYRMLQEALVNVHRHARATRVEVVLARRGKHVGLTIRDNGRGFLAKEGAPPALGAGLLGMRARVRACGGELRIASGADGTTISARLACVDAPTPAAPRRRQAKLRDDPGVAFEE